jgi:hypothetical protein
VQQQIANIMFRLRASLLAKDKNHVLRACLSADRARSNRELYRSKIQGGSVQSAIATPPVGRSKWQKGENQIFPGHQATIHQQIIVIVANGGSPGRMLKNLMP